MIRRMFDALPGPAPVRVFTAVVIVLLVLVALFFFYDWVGTRFLDTGGTLG